jgi:hypothetical protein
MKVWQKTESFEILGLLTGSYHINLAIWNFFSSKSGEYGPFFSWKILCTGRNHISQVEIWQNFAKKKKRRQSVEIRHKYYSGYPSRLKHFDVEYSMYFFPIISAIPVRNCPGTLSGSAVSKLFLKIKCRNLKELKNQ